MNREQMVEKGARALQEYYEPDYPSYGGYLPDAQLVVEAILPEVTTVAELEALPETVKVLADDGSVWSKPLGATRWIGLSPWLGNSEGTISSHDLFSRKETLTVVWTPEVTS